MLNWIVKLFAYKRDRENLNRSAVPHIGSTLEVLDSYDAEHHRLARQRYDLDTTAEAFGIVQHHKEPV